MKKEFGYKPAVVENIEIISLQGKVPSNHGAFIVWIDQCNWRVGTRRCSRGATNSTGNCSFHRDCLPDPGMAEDREAFGKWLHEELNFYGEKNAREFPSLQWGGSSEEKLWSRVSGYDPFDGMREKALTK